MANCGILFGLRHQNEAWHTKGSRGHSPTFHLFNFLSLACNLYLSRSWNICPKSPSVHPASQERHLAINMTEPTIRRSRGRFMFLFAPVPQACFKRNPWNRGSVNRIPLHRSYCYLLFISVTTTHFCEMVNPQNVSTTQTGFYRLYTIFTYTGYTHSTHNLPIPPCFHSKKPYPLDWWFRKFPPTWDAFRSSHRFPQGSQWWELDRAPWLSGIDGYHATGTKLPRGNFKDDGSFLDFWISLRFLFR